MRWFLHGLTCCLALVAVACSSKTTEITTGYQYTSPYKMKSVMVVKPLKGGQSRFELVVGDKTYPLDAEKRFFFKADFPDGVDSFTIRGINPSEQLDAKNMEAFPVAISNMQPSLPITVNMKILVKPTSVLSSSWLLPTVAGLTLGGALIAGLIWWRKSHSD